MLEEELLTEILLELDGEFFSDEDDEDPDEDSLLLRPLLLLLLLLKDFFELFSLPTDDAPFALLPACAFPPSAVTDFFFRFSPIEELEVTLELKYWDPS